MARKHLLLAVALLLLPMVCALSEDFRTSAPQQVDVFFCAPASSQLLVSNTGSVTSVYSVFLEGSAAGFASVDFPSFVLEPGQTATLRVSFAVPCDFKQAQELRTIVRTSFGLEKSFTQQIVPFTPDNVQAEMTPASIEVGPCEVARYDVVLTNPVNFGEEYSFTLTGLDFATLSEERVTLAPGESRNVSIRAEPLDCTMHGEFPFVVSVAASVSGVAEQIEGRLVIEPNFIPSVALGRSRYTNYYADQWIPVRVTNIGERTAVYDVSLSGPNFAVPDVSVLTVAPGEAQVVSVRVSPDADAVPGTYLVALQLTVQETGNVYAAAPFELVLRQHTVFSRFYADHPVITWLVGIGVLVLLLLVAFIAFRMTRPQVREKRAKKRELRRKEREKRKAEKAKQKEARKLEKAKDKVRREEEREKARRDAEIAAKAQEAKRKLEEAARERARREDKKFIVQQAKKDYFLIDKAEQGFTPLARWKKVLVVLGILVVVAVLVFLAGVFWPVLARFSFTVLAALVLLFIVIIALLVRRYNSIPYFTRRENKLRSDTQAARDKIREERRLEKERVKEARRLEKAQDKDRREAARDKASREREALAEQRRKEKELRKQEALERKTAKVEAQKRVPKEVSKDKSASRGWRKWILGLFIVIVLIGAVVLVALFWRSLVQFWPALIVGALVLLAIIAILRGYGRRHMSKHWSDAKGWVFVQTRWNTGLGDVRFKLTGKSEDVRVRIDRGRARDVFVVPSARVYQYFRIEVLAQADRVRASFRVSKRWAERHEVVLQQFVNGSWQSASCKRVSDDGKFVYYVADVNGSGQFAITGVPVARPRRWWPWFLVVAVLCVALGVTVALVGQTTTPDFNGIPPQVWLQDSVHVLDLMRFFGDPDGDALRFSVTPVDNVDIFIDSDGRAVFTPDSGFVGERTVFFSATDERGGVVRSNRVVLRVQPSPVPVNYLPYIKWGIIVVLVLVLLLVLVRFRRQLMAYIDKE